MLREACPETSWGVVGGYCGPLCEFPARASRNIARAGPWGSGGGGGASERKSTKIGIFASAVGDPQGEAIYERTTGIWYRDFEHVSVTFDTGTNRSTIVNRTASDEDNH